MGAGVLGPGQDRIGAPDAAAAARGGEEAFDRLAWVLLAVMPLGMALLNRSAQPILVAAALSAVTARALAGELGLVRDRVLASLQRPVGLLCCAFLAFGAASIAWSHHPRTSVAAFGELLLAASAALALQAALPPRLPGWVVKLATIAAAIGCLTIVAELTTGMALRTQLGLRPHTFIFKRSVTAILILAWPLAILLWASGRAALTIALAALLCLATYAAHSSATALGLSIGAALAMAAAFRPRNVAVAMAVSFAAAFAIAPVLGDLADRALPGRFVEKLEFAHARDRISIWQSFGEVVKRRPLGGAGFGTSPVMPSEPVAEEVPPERRHLLGAWHPHNGFLQIWAETGLFGALLAGAALVLAMLGLRSLRPAQIVAAIGLAGSAAAVMLVGHGLWQGWWSAVIGAALIWIARMPGFAWPSRAQRSSPAAAGRPRNPVART